jgi:hypothetical protein
MSPWKCGIELTGIIIRRECELGVFLKKQVYITAGMCHTFLPHPKKGHNMKQCCPLRGNFCN